MPYALTIEQAQSITDIEMAFSTMRLLPPLDEIPAEFIRGNVYTSLVEKICFNQPLPSLDMALVDGLKPEDLNRVIRAHLQSFGPKHEHKIAGVGYMLSLLCTLSAEPVGTHAPG
ncbi:MAG: hypothetical protein A2580_17860 [Hydrogenophilales bacterium RIFOXYD1_FULL_62_11]|nr:MAG: hypothetical protein A2580_17860 [Hydrogenophilales bacterium RIFOXYD1_FULL_62_11]